MTGQPVLRSVDSESEGHVIELRKSLAEAFSVPLLGAVPPRRDGESPAVPPESQEHEHTDNRGLAGTWEVLTVPRNQAADAGEAARTRKTPPGPQPAHRGGEERTQMRPGYRRAKETKRRGTAVRKS